MPTIIDKIVASDRDDKEELQEQDEFLKSLLQVNEDDILSRVLCADIPATRASATDSVFSGLPLTDAVKFSEEVTLCAASHVESTMAECISDGIKATDIGSLLEQFLEYEKAISPALSPVTPSFPTPVASPSEEEKTEEKPKVKRGQSTSKANMTQAITETPPLTPMEEPRDEIIDFEIIVDNQVTIATTCVDNASTEEESSMPINDCICDTESETNENDCFIVNRNDVIVVEYNDGCQGDETRQQNQLEEDKSCVEFANGIESNGLFHENGTDVDASGEKAPEPDEVKVDEYKGKENKSSLQKDNEDDDEEEHFSASLRSVIGQYYRIPKIPKDSKPRTRSRSPLGRCSKRSFERSKSGNYSSSSDDDYKAHERYERYKSERRTPMRRDDRRKRRKYSSCSDDEYDYYRYSKRGSSSHRDQSPRRLHNEHDYNKPRNHSRRYSRSSSVRERGAREHSSSSQLHKKEPPENDDNVHERLSDLAAPVPYDIEQERKIGFLVKESGTGSHERRNVYAGGIKRNVTRTDLIRRFECFGPVDKVTLHFREVGDNYAFIVFEDAKDAVKAVRDGNKDQHYEPLDLCFGGRRKFVGGSYVDFDANISYLEENELAFSKPASPAADLEFDALLEMAKRQQSVD